MQTKLTFASAPLPGADFMDDLTNKLKSLASSRMGITAPEDVQEGEIWVKVNPDTGEKTVMMRSSGADAEVVASTAVQAATLGGGAVSKSGTTLQFPAYPTTLPANGGTADYANALTNRADWTLAYTPNGGTLIGRWHFINTVGVGSLPSGGTWACFWIDFNASTGAYQTSTGTIISGGTQYGYAGARTIGFAWRIG